MSSILIDAASLDLLTTWQHGSASATYRNETSNALKLCAFADPVLADVAQLCAEIPDDSSSKY